MDKMRKSTMNRVHKREKIVSMNNTDIKDMKDAGNTGKRICAFLISLMLAASLAGCGKQETKDTVTTSADTTKTAVTTRPAEDKKDTESTKKTKKTKKNTKDSDSSSDTKETKTTKKTAKTAKKTETSVKVSLPDSKDKEDESLGWTKEIYEKFRKAETPEDFLRSLTYEEFVIVVKQPDDVAREQYNIVHGIYEDDAAATRPVTQNTAAEMTVETLPEADIEPDIKIDKTVDNELRKVYAKYNVDQDYLCAITGLTEDEFFYYWNNVKDQTFRTNVSNLLYGYNYYDASDQEHTLIMNTISMQIVKAYWDKYGNLHVVCSMMNGYPGLAFNVTLKNLEVIGRNGVVIAKRNDFGELTPHVDEEDENAEFTGLMFNVPVIKDFVFDSGYISKRFADIRNETGLTMKYSFDCGVYNPDA